MSFNSRPISRAARVAQAAAQSHRPRCRSSSSLPSLSSWPSSSTNVVVVVGDGSGPRPLCQRLRRCHRSRPRGATPSRSSEAAIRARAIRRTGICRARLLHRRCSRDARGSTWRARELSLRLPSAPPQAAPNAATAASAAPIVAPLRFIAAPSFAPDAVNVPGEALAGDLCTCSATLRSHAREASPGSGIPSTLRGPRAPRGARRVARPRPRRALPPPRGELRRGPP